jgi:ABC-2 type transport system permease protein
VLPSSAYGGFGALTRLLPSGALGDGLRHALWSGDLRWASLLVLLVWAAVGTALTARTFRWE